MYAGDLIASRCNQPGLWNVEFAVFQSGGKTLDERNLLPRYRASITCLACIGHDPPLCEKSTPGMWRIAFGNGRRERPSDSICAFPPRRRRSPPRSTCCMGDGECDTNALCRGSARRPNRNSFLNQLDGACRQHFDDRHAACGLCFGQPTQGSRLPLERRRFRRTAFHEQFVQCSPPDRYWRYTINCRVPKRALIASQVAERRA